MVKSEGTHPIKLQEASNKPRQEQHGKRMSAKRRKRQKKEQMPEREEKCNEALEEQ